MNETTQTEKVVLPIAGYQDMVKFFFRQLRSYFELNPQAVEMAKGFPVHFGIYRSIEPRSFYFEHNEAVISGTLDDHVSDGLTTDGEREKIIERIKAATTVRHLLSYSDTSTDTKKLVQKDKIETNFSNSYVFSRIYRKVDLYADDRDSLIKIGFRKLEVDFLINQRTQPEAEFYEMIGRLLTEGIAPYPLTGFFLENIVYYSTIEYESPTIDKDEFGDLWAKPRFSFYPAYYQWGVFRSPEYLERNFAVMELVKGEWYAALIAPNDESGRVLRTLVWLNGENRKQPLVPLYLILYHQFKDEHGRLQVYKPNEYYEGKFSGFFERMIEEAGLDQAYWIFFKAEDGLASNRHSWFQFMRGRKPFVENNNTWDREQPVFPEFEVRSWWREMEIDDLPDTSDWSRMDWIFALITFRYQDSVFKVNYPPQRYIFRRLAWLTEAYEACLKMGVNTQNRNLKLLFFKEAKKILDEEYIYLQKGMPINYITYEDNQLYESGKISREESKKRRRHILLGFDGRTLVLYNPHKDANDPYKVIAVNKDHLIIRTVEQEFFRDLANALRPIEWMAAILLISIGVVFAAPVILPLLGRMLSVSALSNRLASEMAKNGAKDAVVNYGGKTVQGLLAPLISVLLLGSDQKTSRFLTGFLIGFTADAFTQLTTNIIDPKNLKKLIPYYGWIRITGFSISATRYLEKVVAAFRNIPEAAREQLIEQLKKIVKGLLELFILIITLSLYFDLKRIAFQKGTVALQKWKKARADLLNILYRVDTSSAKNLLNSLDQLEEEVFQKLDDEVLQPFLDDLDEGGDRISFRDITALLAQGVTGAINKEPEKMGRLIGKLSALIYLRFFKIKKIRERLIPKRSVWEKIKYFFNPVAKLEDELDFNLNSYLKSTVSIGDLLKTNFEVILVVLESFLKSELEEMKAYFQQEYQALNIAEFLFDLGETPENLIKYLLQEEKLPLSLAQLLTSYHQTYLQGITADFDAATVPDLERLYGAGENTPDHKRLTFPLGIHLLLIINKLGEIWRETEHQIGTEKMNGEVLTLRKVFSVLSFADFSDEEMIADEVSRGDFFAFSPAQKADFEKFLRTQQQL